MGCVGDGQETVYGSVLGKGCGGFYVLSKAVVVGTDEFPIGSFGMVVVCSGGNVGYGERVSSVHLVALNLIDLNLHFHYMNV